MSIVIQNIDPSHFEGYWTVLDSVARERLFLAYLQAPPKTGIRHMLEGQLKRGVPRCVALSNDLVVGWCEVVPKQKEGFRHTGDLGMCVLRQWRGCGVGSALLDHIVLSAQAYGLERLQLEVFASNPAAIALYRKFGFVEEGRKREARKIDGGVEDELLMALLMHNQDK